MLEYTSSNTEDAEQQKNKVSVHYWHHVHLGNINSFKKLFRKPKILFYTYIQGWLLNINTF